mgnify:CR=1 FL=1
MRKLLILVLTMITSVIEVYAQGDHFNGSYYKLYIPMTFYRSVAASTLSMQNPDNTGEGLFENVVNESLMNIYLRHPELVKNTQRSVEKSGDIEEQINVPIRQEDKLTEMTGTLSQEPVVAPVGVVVQKPHFWTYKGDYSLQFMQNYVSGNWYKGGESNYAMMGSATMEANYNNKQKVKWDNKLEMKLGLQNNRTDSIHKLLSTEDVIRLTSKLGLQASKKWYYTLQVVGETKFMHAYKSNDPVLYADFFAPFNLNISLGMDYNVDWLNHKLKGTFHLAPIAYNMKYTRLLELSERLGIGDGKHALHDYGSQLTADLTWEISDLIKLKSRMYAYTTYKRVEFEWENTFQFQFSKWISAQLFVYPRFDDSVTRDGHHGYWQFKEFSSLGFTYSF